jgi:hypothetical protein
VLFLLSVVAIAQISGILSGTLDWKNKIIICFYQVTLKRETVPVHAVKAYGGSRSADLLGINL